MMRLKNTRNLSMLPRGRARSILVVGVLLGLITATSATAIPLGSWNQGSEENEWTTGRTFFARIFDGRSATTQESESEDTGPRTGLFGGGHHFAGIDLSVVLGSAREWIVAHVQELPTYEGPRDGQHGSTPVPEPAAALLFAIGVGVVATRRRL